MNSGTDTRVINAAVGRVNALQIFCINLAESLPMTTAQCLASKLQQSIPQIEALANGSVAPDSHNDAMLALLQRLHEALLHPRQPS